MYMDVSLTHTSWKFFLGVFDNFRRHYFIVACPPLTDEVVGDYVARAVVNIREECLDPSGVWHVDPVFVVEIVDVLPEMRIRIALNVLPNLKNKNKKSK